MKFLELTLLFKNGLTTVRSLPLSLTLIFLKKNSRSFIRPSTGHKGPEDVATPFVTSATLCPSRYPGTLPLLVRSEEGLGTLW
jgi:hypothetical protein